MRPALRKIRGEPMHVIISIVHSFLHESGNFLRDTRLGRALCVLVESLSKASMAWQCISGNVT